jgi:hypothetical protein
MSTHQHNLRSKNPKKNYHNLDTVSEPDLIRQTYGPKGLNTETKDNTNTQSDRNNKKLKSSNEDSTDIDNMNIDSKHSLAYENDVPSREQQPSNTQEPIITVN